jgi:hypothetical protein
MMHDSRKSDSSVLPTKSPNDARPSAEEAAEGRGLAKGNASQQNASRTPSRTDALSALERVRQAARRDQKRRFTALLHHVYDVARLRAAFLALKKDAAPGVDGETWRHYEQALEANLQNLSERQKQGAYRAKPVRRVFIPKADGRQRPLGVPVLEDKVVQRATVDTNAIYEADFLGFSYGFRPGRSQHHALDALYVGLLTKKVSWVLDVDIRGFFDTIDHGWLRKFLEHRIADRRIVRLIQKWLNAGVLEEGTRTRVEEGTPQGGSVSPLLANIYLHYVFDLSVTHGVGSTRRATSLSCASRTTSCRGSKSSRMPNDSGRLSPSDSRSSIWSCTPTKRDCSNSVRMRPNDGNGVAWGSQRRSISSASRIPAG